MGSATMTKVDDLLNTCGTGDGDRRHRKLAAATRKAARKYIIGILEEVKGVFHGEGYSDSDLELMIHAFNEGYMAALKNTRA